LDWVIEINSRASVGADRYAGIPAFSQPSLDTFSHFHPQLPRPSAEHPEPHMFSGLGEVHSREQQLIAEKRMPQRGKQFLITWTIRPGLSDFGFSA